MSMTVAREGGRQGMLLGHLHLFHVSDFNWRRQSPKKTSWVHYESGRENGKQQRKSKAFVGFWFEA